MSGSNDGTATIVLNDNTSATNYNLKILNSMVAPQSSMASNESTALRSSSAAFPAGAAQPVVVYQSEYAEPVRQSNQSSSKILILIAGLMILGAAYVIFTGEDDPATNLVKFLESIGELLGWESAAEIEVQKPIAKKPTIKVAATVPYEPSAAEWLAQFSPEMIENPYWYLPNPGPLPDSKTANDDDPRVRAGFENKFVYQNYKAAKEVNRRGLKGYSDVLTRTLNHSKYWTRMEALLALAQERGHVSTEEVELAVGNARSSLIGYHMQRFVAEPTPAALHVLRHMVKLVDAPNRAMILPLLVEQGEYEHRLYLAAATFDPSPEVKNWLGNYLPWHPLTSHTIEEFKIATAQAWHHAAQEAAGDAPATASPVSDAVKDIEQDSKTPSDNVDTQSVEIEEVPVQQVEFYKDASSAGKSAAPSKKAQKKADIEKAKEDGFESLGAKDIEPTPKRR